MELFCLFCVFRIPLFIFVFFFNDTATTEIYTLSLHDALPIWTSSGPIADWGLLLCRTDPTVPKHRGISCVLINMRQPGVEVRPLKQITGASLFSEVFMTNARVEKDDLVGRLGQGWEI